MQHSLEDSVDRSNFLALDVDIKIRHAIQVARKFLEQYNSPVVFKSASLNGDTCEIFMDVGLAQEKIVRVKINTNTGTIIEYVH